MVHDKYMKMVWVSMKVGGRKGWQCALCKKGVGNAELVLLPLSSVGTLLQICDFLWVSCQNL